MDNAPNQSEAAERECQLLIETLAGLREMQSSISVRVIIERCEVAARRLREHFFASSPPRVPAGVSVMRLERNSVEVQSPTGIYRFRLTDSGEVRLMQMERTVGEDWVRYDVDSNGKVWEEDSSGPNSSPPFVQPSDDIMKLVMAEVHTMVRYDPPTMLRKGGKDVPIDAVRI